MILGLDHVQMAMPERGEAKARAFYVGLLGFTEVPKPDLLALRGGCWFRCGEVNLHLGVEREFRPARKAHPAFMVDDLAMLIALLAAAEVEVTTDAALAGVERVYVADPFGNRIELMQRLV